MSITISCRVWEYQATSHAQKLVLLALADQANDDGIAYPSQSTISDRTGVGRTYVNKLLDELEDMKVLKSVIKYRNGSKEYQFNDAFVCRKRKGDPVYSVDRQKLPPVQPVDTPCLPSGQDLSTQQTPPVYSVDTNHNRTISTESLLNPHCAPDGAVEESTLEAKASPVPANAVPNNGTQNTPPKSAAPPRKKFAKPTSLDIDAYLFDVDAVGQIDADAFLDYYEANGWKVGRHPMKDWRAAVRTWLRNRRENPRKGSSAAGSQKPELPWQIQSRIEKLLKAKKDRLAWISRKWDQLTDMPPEIQKEYKQLRDIDIPELEKKLSQLDP